MIQATFICFFLGWLIVTGLLLVVARFIDVYGHKTLPVVRVNRFRED